MVAYALDITNVDPIKYNLLFERFLNPERVSMPDFDIDFCFERRGEVINYVTEKYGTDRVAQIATFGTLKAKAVVKDVARVLDISFEESNRIAKMIPDDLGMTLSKAFAQSPDLVELEKKGAYTPSSSMRLGDLKDGQAHLDPCRRSGDRKGGSHPVRSPVPRCPDRGDLHAILDGAAGTVRSGEDGLLGLKTLTLIEHAQELIRVKNPAFSIEEIDEEDEATFAMLGRGESSAIFQFESPGMQNVLKEAKPGTIEDLVALNALYRPGPMRFIPQYIACKHGRQPITYADPELEEELKNTYGVIVYQEQVMKVAQIIAGYSSEPRIS